jgi:hypothetical protein
VWSWLGGRRSDARDGRGVTRSAVRRDKMVVARARIGSVLAVCGARGAAGADRREISGETESKRGSETESDK